MINVLTVRWIMKDQKKMFSIFYLWGVTWTSWFIFNILHVSFCRRRIAKIIEAGEIYQNRLQYHFSVFWYIYYFLTFNDFFVYSRQQMSKDTKQKTSSYKAIRYLRIPLSDPSWFSRLFCYSLENINLKFVV